MKCSALLVSSLLFSRNFLSLFISFDVLFMLPCHGLVFSSLVSSSVFSSLGLVRLCGVGAGGLPRARVGLGWAGVDWAGVGFTAFYVLCTVRCWAVQCYII